MGPGLGLSPARVVREFAPEVADGARLLALGKIDEPEKTAARQSITAVLQVLRGFGGPDWDVIGDMEAGPTTPFERFHSFADRALVVVGPAWRSAMTARRLVRLIDDIPTTMVASRFRPDTRHPGIAPEMEVPFDPAVTEAERLGLAPLDHCPDSPVVAAVSRIADALVAGPAELAGLAGR